MGTRKRAGLELGGGVCSEYRKSPDGTQHVDMNIAKEKKHGKTRRLIVLKG